MRRHLPAGLGHEGHTEAAHPDGLVTVVLEFEDSSGLEGAGGYGEQHDQQGDDL